MKKHIRAMKEQIRNLIHKLGYDVRRYGPTTMGRDPGWDMRRFVRNDRPLIFDVGANRGQSIERFRKRFPRCTIHAFEPSPTTFEVLKAQTSGLKDVYLWNCGIGSSSGPMTFLESSSPTASSFLPTTSGFEQGTITKKTLVQVRTIDEFCRDENISQIDILKSDTQGFELEVFKGAEQILRSNRVGLIFCEINFSDLYERQPSLTEIYEYLKSRDFALASFYEFHYYKQVASWTDALFVHKSYLPVNPR